MLCSVIFKVHTLIKVFRGEDWNTRFYKINVFVAPNTKPPGKTDSQSPFYCARGKKYRFVAQLPH